MTFKGISEGQEFEDNVEFNQDNLCKIYEINPLKIYEESGDNVMLVYENNNK